MRKKTSLAKIVGRRKKKTDVALIVRLLLSLPLIFSSRNWMNSLAAWSMLSRQSNLPNKRLI